MQLNARQRQFLKGQAHDLEPIVHIGKNGLTDAVIAQLDCALEDHELLKAKVAKECPQKAKEIGDVAGPQLRCVVVQVIGRNLVLYRRHPKTPKIPLPTHT
jgi:RNA-binding protein